MLMHFEMFRLFILYLVFGALALATRADFPENPKPCGYGDSKCIVGVINDLLRKKASEGETSLNLVKLDPLPVAKMNIKQGANSPVNIDLTFTDNNLYGISTMEIRKVKGFGKKIERKHEILLNAPKLSLAGPYNIKGKVLILPISGTGQSNMTLVNTNILVSFTGKAIEKDGATYMEVTDTKIMTKPERLYYHFSNLFNGDKALGDNMNTFLNDNWEAIFMEVQQSIQNAFSDIFKDIITKVFSMYPYEQYFTP